MGQWLIAHEALVRLAAFAGFFTLLALIERARPARALSAERLARWRTNAVLLFSGAAATRLLAALGPAAVAALAGAHDFGLFNWLAAPAWLAFAATLLLLDLALYLQHRAMHVVPLLWRAHAPHHADPDLDVTTGVRFHPLESVLSLVWKSLLVALLGAPVAAVIVFEALLNAFSLFTHANVALPPWFERRVAPWLITPSVHRRHHDLEVGALAPNYGFALAIWDRMFRTWSIGPEPARLGLAAVTPQDAGRARTMLAQPFRAFRP